MLWQKYAYGRKYCDNTIARTELPYFITLLFLLCRKVFTDKFLPHKLDFSVHDNCFLAVPRCYPPSETVFEPGMYYQLGSACSAPLRLSQRFVCFLRNVLTAFETVGGICTMFPCNAANCCHERTCHVYLSPVQHGISFYPSSFLCYNKYFQVARIDKINSLFICTALFPICLPYFLVRSVLHFILEITFSI